MPFHGGGDASWAPLRTITTGGRARDSAPNCAVHRRPVSVRRAGVGLRGTETVRRHEGEPR
ncbi:hypothetical protein GA0070620_0988 [Micromonospora krabiensis]|uniref:Uncharacterized protein n=1 Tax=Micromonospora krabiensis TaxID=307121 RepID=A0A1C3MYV0_9ACTN|nr:hypothetical protein GA0070620_0988 [Micromonospora krabiensis]